MVTRRLGARKPARLAAALVGLVCLEARGWGGCEEGVCVRALQCCPAGLAARVGVPQTWLYCLAQAPVLPRPCSPTVSTRSGCGLGPCGPPHSCEPRFSGAARQPARPPPSLPARGSRRRPAAGPGLGS